MREREPHFEQHPILSPPSLYLPTTFLHSFIHWLPAFLSSHRLRLSPLTTFRQREIVLSQPGRSTTYTISSGLYQSIVLSIPSRRNSWYALYHLCPIFQNKNPQGKDQEFLLHTINTAFKGIPRRMPYSTSFAESESKSSEFIMTCRLQST